MILSLEMNWVMLKSNAILKEDNIRFSLKKKKNTKTKTKKVQNLLDCRNTSMI